MIADRIEERKMYVCPGSQYYVNYNKENKEVQLKTLMMELFVLLPFPMFVGNSFLQHAGVMYLGQHSQRYNVYFVPDDTTIPGTIIWLPWYFTISQFVKIQLINP